jgi:transposase
MAAYSMDLRTRVLQDSDAGMRTDAVAEKYRVSRSWVDRLKQRRRETGEIAPRRQTRWRTPILTPELPRLEALITEQPDRTLAELRHALGTTAGLATIWRAVERLALTLKKNDARLRTGSRRRRHGPGGVAPPHAGD